MQSELISSPAYSNSSTATNTFYSEQTYNTKSDVTIEYSGEGGDLFLRMSSDASYSSTVYTEKGYASSQSRPADTYTLSTDTTSPASAADTSESAGESGQVFSLLLQRYHDLILERVAYLLGEISTQEDGTSGDSEPDSSASASLTYAASISSSQSIEVSGTITDADYFSAENTAQRIVSFALSFYDGGDRGEYAEMVRDAVMEGFNEALGAFGGYLPQVSYDTINLVNEAIDEFASGGSINISA